jgi:hypothetical protein
MCSEAGLLTGIYHLAIRTLTMTFVEFLSYVWTLALGSKEEVAKALPA